MQANELFTQPNTILLDGGMGTMLQAAGLKLGARPEELNITDPQLIESIHSRYAAAGSRIINANTFGASAHKLAGSAYSLEEIIAAGIANCKRACAPYGALAALDVGPLGELLEPNGTLAFEDAVAEYGRIVRAGVAAGADLVFFETFTDLYELKAALLAAKENCDLPILASMSFEAGGRTFTGCTVESFAVTARGLGANAVGINCSLGPKEIFPMAKRLAEALPGDFPVFVKPNAGLPRADGSGYDITPQLFAMEMKPYRDLKLFAAGGCCGTTPDFIKLLNGVFADCKPGRPAHAMNVGVLRHGGRLSGEGSDHHRRAHQPHRQKAVPASPARGRHELHPRAGRQPVRGRSAGAGRQRGRARRGRACRHGAGGEGAAERRQPALAAGFLPRRRPRAGPAGLQRQAHRQLGERRDRSAGACPAPLQKVRRGRRRPCHRRAGHPAQRRRPV